MQLSRRDVLRSGLGLAIAGRAWAAPLEQFRGRVMTVRGPIDPAEMGVTLPHEHVLVDFIGADRATPDRYDADEVTRIALPHLEQIKALGVGTLVECTPAYLGRDVRLLERLSQRTGLHILTNSGYYNATRGAHLPAHARTESAEQLAARWVREWTEGIDGIGIRPGFLKIGVEPGPLGDLSRKLARAAALTHRETGLVIACHCGNGRSAIDALTELERVGVEPSAFIWVHAQSEPDQGLHRQVAARGAWVEFDGIAPISLEKHLQYVRGLADSGHLGRILLSHDAGWYHVGEPGGGDFRPFDTLLTAFLPELRKGGFDDRSIDRLTRANPQAAFTIRG